MDKTIKDLIEELQSLDLPPETLVKVSIYGAICDMDFIYRDYKVEGKPMQLLMEQNLN